MNIQYYRLCSNYQFNDLNIMNNHSERFSKIHIY